MDIEVDTALVEAAAQRAVAAAGGLRELAAAGGRLTHAVSEPAVAHGLGVLADVVGDAFEVVALDLALLARSLRAGADDYAATEQALLPTDGTG